MKGSKRDDVLLEISSGGMGVVELILRRESGFERLYARKRLLPELVRDPSVRAMFLDEARIAGLIRHPEVVSVHDVGEDARGPFLVMDYVEGVPAHALVTRAAERGEALPVSACLELAAAVARGLHAAHELKGPDGASLSLVHRDVSPHNVLVGFDGTVHLTDFGIAKGLGQSARTSTGVLKGKLGYMSPEQLRFEPLDRRSDLFSLGVVLYELLSGRRLYRSADGTETAARILREPPPDLGQEREDVSPELVGLLFELLAKEPAHRPGTAEEVADRLTELLTEARIADEDHRTLRQYMESALSYVRDARAEEIAEARSRLAQREPAASSPTVRPSRRAAIFGVAGVTGLAAGAVFIAILQPWSGVAPSPADPPPIATPANEDPVEVATASPSAEPPLVEAPAAPEPPAPIAPEPREARSVSSRRRSAPARAPEPEAAPAPANVDPPPP
ncbi:MAG: serine/threonine-protein kinase, partial [Sandaracinaceae bacterium]